jgi:hypothetical protein
VGAAAPFDEALRDKVAQSIAQPYPVVAFKAKGSGNLSLAGIFGIFCDEFKQRLPAWPT